MPPAHALCSHGHKNTILDVKWNRNGNWLLTSAKDQQIKLHDIRMMKEIKSFRAHKKEINAVSWHPIHESLFASGGAEGSIFFWLTDAEKEVGGLEQAHDGIVWSLDWHPLGHILCSSSSDFSTRFWTRNRPGDQVHDKFVLGQQLATQMGIQTPTFAFDFDEDEVLPGLGGRDDRRPARPAHQMPAPFRPPMPMPSAGFPQLPAGFVPPPGFRPPLPPLPSMPPMHSMSAGFRPPPPPPPPSSDPRRRR